MEQRRLENALEPVFDICPQSNVTKGMMHMKTFRKLLMLAAVALLSIMAIGCHLEQPPGPPGLPPPPPVPVPGP
jgi:hypothetical protein